MIKTLFSIRTTRVVFCRVGQLTVSLALVLAATIARAGEPAPPPPKWDSTVTLGASLTRGNSKTFLGTVLANTKRSWTNDEALFGASAGYGKTTTEVGGVDVDKTTDSYVKGYGQYNHLFTPRLYAGLRVTGEHDDVAALAYRLTISPLAGYYFIKRTNAFLAAEFGPSYVREEFFNENADDAIGLRLAERGEWKFDTGAKIWENIEILPKVEHFDDYLMNAEAGISAPMSKALSLSLIVQDTYKNKPASDKLKNDLKVIAGLTYSF